MKFKKYFGKWDIFCDFKTLWYSCNMITSYIMLSNWVLRHAWNSSARILAVNLIPMYVDLEPIAKSKITNPSVLVREDLLVIHLFHAGNSPVKTCAFPILVDQVPNANLEMTGLVQIDPCVLVLLDIVVILWFLVQEVSKNVYFFSKLCFYFYF